MIIWVWLISLRANVQCETWKRRCSDFTNYLIFWSITLCSLLKVSRGFGGICLLATCFMLDSCLPHPSKLKMQAIFFSETSVRFQRTTWRYVPEDRTLHKRLCENLKSYWAICSTLKELITSTNHKSIQSNLKQHSSVEDHITIHGMSCKTLTSL
jgi:hypothetical protein